MSLHWKMHTNFPFTRVFVLGIILFFLGVASMIISIISFVTESWGHYVATGMWGGASILATGSTAIFASRLKSLASVKTLLICSVVTSFSSLTMLILSAGGLSLSSGFYNRIDPSEYNKRTSNLIHASLLVISVFCLSGNVLAVIVCTKYLFFEPYDKSKHRRRHHRHLPEGTIRVSTSLRGGAPNTSSARSSTVRPHQLLINENPVRRHSENAGVNRVQIEYRRAHRRSSSDQPNSQQLHLHSQSRRQRHSHQETALSINGSSPSNPQSSGTRYRHGKHSSGRTFHHEKPSKGETEVERLITSPERHSSLRSASNQATLQVRMAPTQISSCSQQIRLPTDFDEEELPPYEPTDSTQVQRGLRCSDCDSGDESDTENSSSTDAHSYDAVELCVEGAEAVPMVNLRHQRTYRSRRSEQQTTHFLSPPISTPEVDENRSRNAVRRSRTFDFYDKQFKKPNQRKSIHSDSDQTLNHSQPPVDRLGEYECLISVSPEVCAITGESSAVAPESDKFPHLVNENPYENGPCYENVRAIGIGNGEVQLNPLSKSCASTTEHKVSSMANNLEHKVTASTASARVVPVQMVTPSSADSPTSLRKSFGSPNSAFRPVKPPSQPHSPLHIHHSLLYSPHRQTSNKFDSLPPNMCISPLDNTPTPAPVTDLGDSRQKSCNNEVNKYLEQGAIPKSARSQRKNVQKEETVSLSWKNIPLPLSHNHSESISNDEEKKLPSKDIPFAEPNENATKEDSNSATHEMSNQRIFNPLTSQIRSSKSFPLSTPTSHQNLSPSSSFARQPLCTEPPIIPAEMLSSAPVLSFSSENTVPVKTKDRTLITTQPLSPPTQTSSSLSSLALASLQETSFLRSGPPQQMMGGNQSLLQSRRDEIRNLHLNQRPARWQRPSSLIDDQHLSVTNNQDSLSPNSPVDRETSWSSADRTHPLSLSLYLMGQQPSSSQNHQRRQPLNSHHHVPQPQQPRLGVQLQRRPPQHVMMNNNEHDYHQHHQPQAPRQPQQQRAAAQADNGQQQQRNNRPLFSLLL